MPFTLYDADKHRQTITVSELTAAGGALEHVDVLSPMSLTVYTTAAGGVG